MKDLYHEVSKKYSQMEMSQKSDTIYKSKFSDQNTLILYLKEKDKNMIIYFLNSEKDKSRYNILNYLFNQEKIILSKYQSRKFANNWNVV